MSTPLTTYRPGTRRAAVPALCCLGVLLIATTFQAVHVCNSFVAGAEGKSHSRTQSSTATSCLTCLLAQPSVAAESRVALASLQHQDQGVAVPQDALRSVLRYFELDIRPPPAA